MDRVLIDVVPPGHVNRGENIVGAVCVHALVFFILRGHASPSEITNRYCNSGSYKMWAVELLLQILHDQNRAETEVFNYILIYPDQFQQQRFNVRQVQGVRMHDNGVRDVGMD